MVMLLRKAVPKGWGEADTTTTSPHGLNVGDHIFHHEHGVGTVVSKAKLGVFYARFPRPAAAVLPGGYNEKEHPARPEGIRVPRVAIAEHLPVAHLLPPHHDSMPYPADSAYKKTLPVGTWVHHYQHGFGRVMRHSEEGSNAVTVHYPNDAAASSRLTTKSAVRIVRPGASPAAPAVPPRPPVPAEARVPLATQEQYEKVHRNMEPRIKTAADYHGGTPEEFLDDAHEAMHKVIANSRLVVRVPSAHLGRILQEGLRNQHHTKSSSAFLGPETRARAEHKMFGIPLDAPPHEYPTYGYLEPRDGDGVKAASSYGDARLVLKDHVRPRTTFTVGDSLFSGLEDEHVPAPLLAPHWTAADGHAVNVGADKDRPVADQLKHGGYWEAQFHGPVTHEDIDHVVFDHEPDLRERRALEAHGIPHKVVGQENLLHPNRQEQRRREEAGLRITL